jgi:hypothetical protein
MKGLKTFCADRVVLSVSSAFLLAFGLLENAQAQIYSANNFGSSISVNVGQGVGGLKQWMVGGVNQADQEWLYYRIGTSGPAFGIDHISAAPTVNTATPGQIDVTYDNGSYSAEVKYLITGSSLLNESIVFNNHSGSALDLHFFDYSDYDLNGSDNGQSLGWFHKGVVIPTTNSFWQTLGGIALTNTVSSSPTANPTRYEADATTGTLLMNITNTVNYTLNNVASAGPGDANGALEWDLSLATGSALTISELISLQVPEPSSVAIVSLGILSMWFGCANRRSSKTNLN